jgi:hypothetical protein
MTAPKGKEPELNLMIGRAVWWFPRAERSNGPRPAMVTGPMYAHPEGILHLRVWEERCMQGEVVRNVRRMDDPRLETHPRMREAGGWEPIPDPEVPQKKAEVPPVKAKAE